MEKRLTKKETTGDYVFVDGESACPNEIARKIGELEDIEDIISELNDLHRQEQILLNRLEYKLKEKLWLHLTNC